MTQTLAIYDQRPGSVRTLNRQIEVAAERITARDLIRSRIEAEVCEHNAAERARLAGEVTDYQLTRAMPNQWLVRPGQLGFSLSTLLLR